MGAVTHGAVLEGRAADELVPFGEQSHKAFALAVGLEALVGALAGPGRERCFSSPGPRTTRCRAALARCREAATGRLTARRRAASASSWAAANVVIPSERARSKTPASVPGMPCALHRVLDVVAARAGLAAHVDDPAGVDDVVRRVEDAAHAQHLQVPLLVEQLVVRRPGDDRAHRGRGIVSSLRTPPSAHGARTSHSTSRAILGRDGLGAGSTARRRIRVHVRRDEAPARLDHVPGEARLTPHRRPGWPQSGRELPAARRFERRGADPEEDAERGRLPRVAASPPRP